MISEDDRPEYAESPEEYVRLLKKKRAQEESEYSEYASTPEYELDLREAAAEYLDVSKFSPGDLVQWKRRMKDQHYPAIGKPGVVLRVFDPPITRDPNGDYVPEGYDLLVGFLDGDGDLRVFPFRSNRLTTWIAPKY
jgi:hypothetical protein